MRGVDAARRAMSDAMAPAVRSDGVMYWLDEGVRRMSKAVCPYSVLVAGLSTPVVEVSPLFVPGNDESNPVYRATKRRALAAEGRAMRAAPSHAASTPSTPRPSARPPSTLRRST